MKIVELLAPAKNYETAIAAINSGADAVYIGASDFGARKNAPNSLKDIENLVKYAHEFMVGFTLQLIQFLMIQSLKKRLN